MTSTAPLLSSFFGSTGEYLRKAYGEGRNVQKKLVMYRYIILRCSVTNPNERMRRDETTREDKVKACSGDIDVSAGNELNVSN